MKNYIFPIIILLSFLITSCNRNPKSDYNEEIENLIIGKWIRNNDPLYSLNFQKNDNEEIECVFSNGGPFEEYLRCKLTADNKIDLYFSEILGSNSFLNANAPSNQDSCSTKVMSCFLADTNQLLVNTYEDKCGQIVEEKDVILTKDTE